MTWRGYCDGDDSLDWQGAAADILPARNLGDDKFDAGANDGVIDMASTTSGGEVRITT